MCWHFYTTHKHSLEIVVKGIQPKKSREKVQVLTLGFWYFYFTTCEKGSNDSLKQKEFCTDISLVQN